jgi:arabinan endo-1,5-alpha-L-arabinosidase
MTPPRLPRRAAVLAAALVACGCAPVAASASGTYTNPLPVSIPGDGRVTSCADPSVIRGRGPDAGWWFAYCTTDPLNPSDRAASGGFNFHLVPTLRSRDLVHWTYVGDAFSSRPAYATADAALWAPDIEYRGGRYLLYYTVTDTDPGDRAASAIGVAWSDRAAGPWHHNARPVVAPAPAPGSTDPNPRWTFDPDIVVSNGTPYIFYGSYFGGISARRLTDDGLRSLPATQRQITIGNRYEGANVVRHGDWWYLLVSAANCCNGQLTGYSVFAGRARSLLGPYVDRDGVSLLAGRTGGTPVLSMNGNRWVGPGHVDHFTDLSGQSWLLLHAVDRFHPYFEPGFTRRPLMLDPLDWVRGWPTVRSGRWISSTQQPAPVAQPGDTASYRPRPPLPPQRPGGAVDSLTTTFSGSSLPPRFTWVRNPGASGWSLRNGRFVFPTQAGDLFEDSNDASVLTERAPSGDYVVQTRVRLDLPPEGCCFNYVQAGLVIYKGDDNFIKLTHVSIWETRQTEFAKEMFPVPAGWARYGNTVVGAPGEWTTLRIVVDRRPSGERYTAYTRGDGRPWVRGGTWTHMLGSDARIGLVSFGGTGFTAQFDDLRVYRLAG